MHVISNASSYTKEVFFPRGVFKLFFIQKNFNEKTGKKELNYLFVYRCICP